MKIIHTTFATKLSPSVKAAVEESEAQDRYCIVRYYNASNELVDGCTCCLDDGHSDQEDMAVWLEDMQRDHAGVSHGAFIIVDLEDGKVERSVVIEFEM